jgi:hypothetical protein
LLGWCSHHKKTWVSSKYFKTYPCWKIW